MDYPQALSDPCADFSLRGAADNAVAMTIGEKVRELLDRGMTQEAIAEAVGVAQSTINRWSRDQVDPKGSSRDKLTHLHKTFMEALSAEAGPSSPKVDFDRAAAVGRAIRQVRKQRGFVIRQTAELLGIDASAASDAEAGRIALTAEQIKKVAVFLGIEPLSLARGEVVQVDDALLGDAAFISGSQQPFAGPRDVEKLGVVAAGNDGDFQFNGEVAEYVARPRGLVGRPGVFALEVISESMYPAYRKSDIIFCDRTEPQIGDDVVIETFPNDGALVGKSFVKRLIRRTQKALIVEQFSPPTELTFDPYAVKHVWRVVPNRELHGY